MSPERLRVVLIDNYDSFTHNLTHLCARVTGRLPEVVRNDAATAGEIAALAPDAIVISPGPGAPDVPADVGICRELVERLRGTPILGVCLGHQVIATAFGGRVVPAPEPMHGRIARVRHDRCGLFAGLPEPLRVVRYHSLIVDRATLPPSLRVTAWLDDPASAPMVMAIAHEQRPLYGVQFHPESILTEGGAEIIANFLALAAAVQQTPRRRPPAAPSPAPIARVARARTISADVPFIDPEHAFVALYRNAASAFWLDGNGRYSYMGECSRESIAVRGAQLERRTLKGVERIEGDPFALIDDLVVQRSMEPQPGEGGYPFRAGYVGWLGYELKQFCEGGDGPRDAAALPDALLMLADRVLAFDRERRAACLFALVHGGQPEAVARRWLNEEKGRLAAVPPVSAPEPLALPPGTRTPLRVHLAADRARYRESVERIHALLRAGDTYEICLTTRATVRLPPDAAPLDPLLLHRLLRLRNPAPWSSYLRFPGGAVVSASPERFVHIAPNGVVESRPIKGTRTRGATAIEDAHLGAALAASEKDRSENLMIVDLVRHDLGRVCDPGSVEVPALMQVEAHPALFQLVSTVRGRLRKDVSPLAAVRALFPGGSMTGAPKIRAMRIIAELEGAPRGVYSGGIGMLGFDGTVDLAMAIRTITVHGHEVSFGVGGAVVALSDADDEYEEALLKGRALATAIALAAGRPLAPDDPFC